MVEWLGWAATAIFAGSYFCKEAATLRRLQAFAALLWIGYGVVLQAAPVIVANSIVAVLAVYSSWPRRAQQGE
jgi:uncharacterized integral membrane protein